MKAPTESQLQAVAERYNLELDGNDVADLRTTVGENLRAVERLANLPMETPSRGDSNRAWRRVEPGIEYEHNEIITECQVPPLTDNGLLAGLKIGLKDTIEVADIPMTAASAVLSGYVPRRDAPIVNRLLEAGGTITAKTNLDEFGNAGLGTNGFRGAITNPLDPTRTAGGSSGGSAVAVATSTVDAALGTDTGGSVRIPAAYCGVVGMKPSFGLVPRAGVVENTRILDHVGPIATDVETVARMLEALVGAHVDDPTSLQAAARPSYTDEGYLAAVQNPPSPSEVSVGIIKESYDGPCRAEVVDQTRAAVDQLSTAGVEIRTVSVPHYAYGIPVKNGLSYPANATMWRDCGIPARHGERVRQRGDHRAELPHRMAAFGGALNVDMKAKILTGALMMEARGGRDYIRAHAGRALLRSEFQTALSEVDVLLTPTMPDIAPLLTECPPSYDYGWNVRHANIAHIPAITLPNGRVEGLPVGLQLLGAQDDDATVLGVAKTVGAVLS